MLNSTSKIRVYLPLLLALSGLGFLSACQFNPFVESNTIMEPPLIPAMLGSESSSTVEANSGQVLTYADLLEWENNKSYPVELIPAVHSAIKQGILHPANLTERFEPGQLITYGQFRDWLLGYQAAEMRPEQDLSSPDGKTVFAKAPQSARPKPDPMSQNRLNNPPRILELDDQVVQPNDVLNRETLCYLYFMGQPQFQTIQALSPEQIDQMSPDEEESGLGNSFSQFQDYTSISPWAKPAVAQLYKTGQLQRLFNTSSAQLTIDNGFNPQGPVNKAQAIVLLHWLYDQKEKQEPVPIVPEVVKAKETNASVQPNMPNKDVRTKLTIPRQPPSSLAKPNLPATKPALDKPTAPKQDALYVPAIEPDPALARPQGQHSRISTPEN